jgi:hypothetical protein
MRELIDYFFSPFVRPKLKFYFGKTKIGVPYFYPRKLVMDPEKPGYQKFVTKKIGFDYCKLGWKTKWDNNDYRFEWSPVLSFVFFGFQLAIIVHAKEQDHYWMPWLYYHKSTDKNKPIGERVKDCIENFPQTWTRTTKDKSETIDYYQLILKKKWRPKDQSEKRENKINSILK